MPATITHTFFAEDVYNKLDPFTKKIIDKNKKAYLMFSQSMDSMMFYNIFTIKKKKIIKDFSYEFHTTKINTYFDCLIKYIKKKKYYNDSLCLAYLYGLICHHTLDSTIHPYIFYKTGLFNKQKKETWKYNSLHNYMETYIDNYLYEQRGYNYKNLNFKTLCFDLNKFSNNLNDIIKYSFKKVFKINNMDIIYYKSLNRMCKFLQLFRKDTYGIKKAGYKLVNLLTFKNAIRLDCLSYYNVKNNTDYLNLKKNTWNYPVKKTMTYNKTFFELYDESISTTVKIITKINKYFFDNKNINIANLFHNKSYLTGLDCDLDLEQVYFEF